MYTRRTGGARYVPDFARSRSDWRFASRFSRILGPGLSVHARCPVLAGPVEGRFEPVDVHQIGQRSESHLRRSFRQLGYPLLFRVIRSSNLQAFAVCPNNESMYPDASLPSTGSARAIVPPLPRYYQGTATSCRPSRRASFPSLGGTTGARIVSLPPPLRVAASGLGLVTRYPRPGLLPWRRQDLPSSWGTPIPVCTCSSTPAGRCVPDHCGTLAWPPLQGTTKAPTISKLSRLNSMAFGLAAYVSRCWLPATAQDWLPGAGQALLDGLSPAGFR